MTNWCEYQNLITPKNLSLIVNLSKYGACHDNKNGPNIWKMISSYYIELFLIISRMCDTYIFICFFNTKMSYIQYYYFRVYSNKYYYLLKKMFIPHWLCVSSTRCL